MSKKKDEATTTANESAPEAYLGQPLPSPDSFTLQRRLEREIVREKQDDGSEVQVLTVLPQITAADLDELLALLPKSQTELIAAQRYGDDIWPKFERVREKILELKKRL